MPPTAPASRDEISFPDRRRSFPGLWSGYVFACLDRLLGAHVRFCIVNEFPCLESPSTRLWGSHSRDFPSSQQEADLSLANARTIS
jgi:hypothetical protein